MHSFKDVENYLKFVKANCNLLEREKDLTFPNLEVVEDKRLNIYWKKLKLALENIY